MQTIIGNNHYLFVPSKVISFNGIVKKKKILVNDIYEKYKAYTKVYGELIICKDSSKLKNNKNNHICNETYEEYLDCLQKRDPSIDKWIYNIIDGIEEQSSILYRDEKCIVIPTYIWDSTTIDKLHILCIPTDITLRTIRSLSESHIPLLEHMKQVTLKTIHQKYNIDKKCIKMYFHYNPSTYHLHIHFVNILVPGGSSVEYTHDLDSVIFNLSICSDYYKRKPLNVIV